MVVGDKPGLGMRFRFQFPAVVVVELSEEGHTGEALSILFFPSIGCAI